MGFGEAVKLFFTRYVDFKGRSRRAEYWWPVLMNVLVMVVLGGGGFILAGGIEAMEYGEPAVPGIILWGILGLYFLAIIIPTYALFARRLHDINLTAWLILAFIVASLIPIVSLLASIGQIVVGCIPGTKGANKYGDDPKNPGLDVADTFD